MKVGVAAPVVLARNPAVAEAPGASVAFQVAAWIMPEGPLCMDVPFHAWVIVVPIGIVHWMYQLLIGALPVFLIVAEAWNPPDQEFSSVTVAVHEVGGGVAGGGELGGGEPGGGELGGGVEVPPKITSEQP